MSSRLNQLQKVTLGDPEQLVHITQLDLRDTGLLELDIMPLCRLELLRCDRNTLYLLRVSGYALKSLHAADNGTDIYHMMQYGSDAMFVLTLQFLFAELKLLEVQPVPENLTMVDLSRYEVFMNTSLSYLLCGKEGCVLVLGADCICFVKGTSWDVSLSGCVRAANWRFWTSAIIPSQSCQYSKHNADTPAVVKLLCLITQ